MSVSWRGLYAIVDPAGCGARPAEEVADRVLAGGCAVLQLRVKGGLSDRAILALARDLRVRSRRAGTPFVMNDRADVARIVDADGLHLGQDDPSVRDARVVVGSMPIGVSTHDEAQAVAAAAEGADLVAFGPIFGTASKERPDPTVGLDRLRTVCATLPVPVVAIGGIDLARAGDVVDAGASLVAVISAVCHAADPAEAARALSREIAR